MKTKQFNEGYEARVNGVQAYRNPYLVMPGRERSAHDWRSGWTKADGDIYCKKHGICSQLQVQRSEAGLNHGKKLVAIEVNVSRGVVLKKKIFR